MKSLINDIRSAVEEIEREKLQLPQRIQEYANACARLVPLASAAANWMEAHPLKQIPPMNPQNSGASPKPSQKSEA